MGLLAKKKSLDIPYVIFLDTYFFSSCISNYLTSLPVFVHAILSLLLHVYPENWVTMSAQILPLWCLWQINAVFNCNFHLYLCGAWVIFYWYIQRLKEVHWETGRWESDHPSSLDQDTSGTPLIMRTWSIMIRIVKPSLKSFWIISPFYTKCSVRLSSTGFRAYKSRNYKMD